MNIFLIAGHGAGDSGATGNGYQEADLTREVVGNNSKYLAECANVVVGDINRDWFTWLKTNTFDFQTYDYVLEVHYNSGANDLSGDGKITGSEIYVTTSEVHLTVEESILAEMQKLGFTNRGVKKKNFSVISKVKAQGVSSALLEVAFVDDRDDMNLYEKEKYAVARAISDGIAKGFGLKESEELTLKQYEELSNRIDELERKAGDTRMIYNYIDENMPVWARETIRKLADKGLLKGNEDGELALSDEMLRMFVINDRAGLYGD